MSRRTMLDREPPTVVSNTPTIPQRASRLPRKLRFPILLILNFWLRTALWTTTTNLLGQELGTVSRNENDNVHVLARTAYRIGFVLFTWKRGYDWIDVSALSVLVHIPYLYLLNTYFGVSSLTVAAFCANEVVSLALPTFLLRPRAPLHNPNVPLRNRFLLDSFQVQTSTAILAISVYATVIWSAVKTGVLNKFLVTHFDVRSVEDAYTETPVSIIVKVAFAGFAARTFLLNPSIGAQTAPESAEVNKFDPATATLSETLQYNFWYFSKRTKTLIRRSAVISAFMFVETVARTSTLSEFDLTGAMGYAGLWVFATLCTSAWWVWVGETDKA
ncbi:hypothetical protein M011DRAFT_403861 [Sporormia fimetaria CBS 119925]|uniref:Uncharacterized protein n=1 Tax=Sporormia fimetaria CBS 119925 TaxID=1340428 RepID=A0A6A6V800_9PLEO|nr:hypothetical protein M011DRAFT_403861 [Sporormia fimetaria CBS 119925]